MNEYDDKDDEDDDADDDNGADDYDANDDVHCSWWRHKQWFWWSVRLDNSKLGLTQQQKICWHWHVARIISSQKIYSLYARKHHIVEIGGDVTDAGRQTKTEDRATQPKEAGGWVSQKAVLKSLTLHVIWSQVIKLRRQIDLFGLKWKYKLASHEKVQGTRLSHIYSYISYHNLMSQDVQLHKLFWTNQIKEKHFYENFEKYGITSLLFHHC